MSLIRGPLSTLIELEAENAYLRRELEALWKWFHAERCQRDWPHEGFCWLPRESILGEDGVGYTKALEKRWTYEG